MLSLLTEESIEGFGVNAATAQDHTDDPATANVRPRLTAVREYLRRVTPGVLQRISQDGQDVESPLGVRQTGDPDHVRGQPLGPGRHGVEGVAEDVAEDARL